MNNNRMLKYNKKSEKRNKARIEVLYEKVFELLAKIVRTKAFKIVSIFVIIIAVAAGIEFAYWKYSGMSSVFPDEMYGTWYEFDEKLTVEEFEKKDFEVKKFFIDEKEGIIKYLERPSLNEKSVDYMTGSDRHQGAEFGKLLIPSETYTFHYPSFTIHRLSDYKVTDGTLHITIDGEKKVFEGSRNAVINRYVKKFYGIEDVHKYYRQYLIDNGAEEISYTRFMELLETGNTNIIMFSEYVDYKIVTANKTQWDTILNDDKVNWYFVDGKNITNEEYPEILGSEIGKYLGIEFTMVWSDTLEQPVVIPLDGSENPEFYRIFDDFDEMKKIIGF